MIPPLEKFNTIPDPSTWNVRPDADYFYYCSNETVEGVEIHQFPWEVVPEGMPVVADMSSHFASKEIEWDKHHVVLAGAQKNVGPAGATIVCVRKELIGHEIEGTPVMCSWTDFSKAPTRHKNTPCCWAIYMAGLSLKFMREKTLKAIKEEADQKSNLLYEFFESTDGYYENPVDKHCRSRMNIPFRVCQNADLEKKFLSEATDSNFIDLKGHRTVGGCRVSVYNAQPIESVKALIDFMKTFMENNPRPQ